MMKSCEYCGNTIENRSSKAKYCSDTCKSQAYISRKANPEIAGVKADDTTVYTANRRNGRNVKTPAIPFSSSQVDKLLNGSRTNHEMFKMLLNEKDRVGAERSENGVLALRLEMLQRDYDRLLSDYDILKKENSDLKSKVELDESPFIDKVMEYLEKQPMIGAILAQKFADSNLMASIAGIGSNATAKNTTTKKTSPENSDTETPKQ